LPSVATCGYTKYRFIKTSITIVLIYFDIFSFKKSYLKDFRASKKLFDGA
jgi:hypothetical protein